MRCVFVLAAVVFVSAENLPEVTPQPVVEEAVPANLVPPAHPDSEESEQSLDFGDEDEEDEYIYDPIEELPQWMEDSDCSPVHEETTCAMMAEKSKCAWVPLNCKLVWRPECDTYAIATKTLGVAIEAYSEEELESGMVEKIASSLFGRHRRLEDGYCCSQAPDCRIMDNDECGDHTNCEVTTHLTDSCTAEPSCYSKDYSPPAPVCNLPHSQLPADFLAEYPEGLDEDSCGHGYFQYGSDGWEWDQCEAKKWFNKSRWFWPKKQADYNVCKWKVLTGTCEVVRPNQY